MILTSNNNVENKIGTELNAPKKKVTRIIPKTVIGPGSGVEIKSGIEYTFVLDAYKYRTEESGKNYFDLSEFESLDEEQAFDSLKDLMKWALWVTDPAEPTTVLGFEDKISKGYVQVVPKEQKEEYHRDILLDKSEPQKVMELLDYAYTYAVLDTFVDADGIKKNRLKIKFSQWLTGYTVHIEAYRYNAEIESNDYEFALSVSDKNILKSYWLDIHDKRITYSKFNSQIYMALVTLGMDGLSATISLYYEHNGTEYSLNWNGTNATHNFIIADRLTRIPFTLEQDNHSIFDQIQGHQGSTDIEFKVRIVVTDPADGTNILTHEELILKVVDSDVVSAYLATEEVLVYEGSTEPTHFYNTLSDITLSSKAILVVEAPTLDDGEVIFVSFYNYELYTSGVQSCPNGNIPLINDAGNQVFQLECTIFNGRAEKCIDFQNQETNEFVEIDNWLTANPSESFDIVFSHYVLNIPSVCDAFKLVKGLVVQKIYHDGFISKENYVEGVTKHVKYEYHAADNIIHDLGTFEIIWVQKFKPGTKTVPPKEKLLGTHYVKGGSYYYYYEGEKGKIKVPLVSIFPGAKDDPNPEKGNLKKFDSPTLNLEIYESSEREYAKPISWATFLGGVIKSNYKDVSINGSVQGAQVFINSGLAGTGKPSKTHVNGESIDIKYLRKDEKIPYIDTATEEPLINGKAHRLNLANSPNIKRNDTEAVKKAKIKAAKDLDKIHYDQLDVTRTQNLINCLRDFGWGKIPGRQKILAWWIEYDNKTKKFDHTQVTSPHQHHFHIHNLKPNYK